MKKLTILICIMCVVLVGCQSERATTVFSFGDDLVFREVNGHMEIDLENSSKKVQEKHNALREILKDIETVEDIAVTTTTTANIFWKAGIQVTAAPQSESLHEEVAALQYTLGGDQKIEKSKVLNVGSALDPNIEAIVELSPKVVLYSSALPHAKYISILEDAGIQVQPIAQSDYIDMFVLLDVIGKLYYYENETTNALFSEMLDTLKKVQEKIDMQEGKVQSTVAVLLVSGEVVMANNNDTVLGGIVSSLGMNNVFKNNGNVEVSKEELLSINPKYIIYYTHGNAQESLQEFYDSLYAEDSIYRALDAVKNNRVFAVAADDFTFAASVDLDIVKVIAFLAEKFYE